ncbi:hypothetical protein ACLB2K_037502 [Fragaria x ananassa]
MKTDQYGILSVNTATSSYEDDPFVFATSADDEEEDVAYQEPNAIGIPNSSTVRLNNFKAGRSVRIRDEEPRLIDVDPNQETDEDSGDEERHILSEINSDTEEDSSDDSDYEP